MIEPLMHEFLIKKLASKIKQPLYLIIMSEFSLDKIISHLKPGKVYRRAALLPYSSAIDRNLMVLTDKGILEKLAVGLYYQPINSRFGALPPDDKELIQAFLQDKHFLLYSWNQYNSLGLGLTQLYNQVVVYNRKRHGLFKLGRKVFDFRRPTRGFPLTATPEFLLVDLINNINELTEDSEFVKAQIKNNLYRFNAKKLAWHVKHFGKIATKYFFKGLNE